MTLQVTYNGLRLKDENFDTQEQVDNHIEWLNENFIPGLLITKVIA